MIDKRKQASLAKLNNCNNDLNKQWFVYFSVRHPETGKLERVKLYEGFARFATVEERTQHGERLIKETNKKLNTGWNPIAEKYILQTDPEKLPSTSIALTATLKEQKINLRTKSFQSYESHLRGFCAWLLKEGLEDTSINEITSQQANHFIRHLLIDKSTSVTTRNAYLRTLKTLFNKFIDHQAPDLNLKNPFAKIKKIGNTSRSARPFSENQIQLLKENISARDPQLWFFIQFMFYCYIRPTEIRRLKIGDIHGDKIQVRGEISKNKKTEYVAIPRPFMNFLKVQGVFTYPESYYIFGRDGRPGPKNYSANHFSNKHLEILRELNFSSQHKFYSWKHTGVVIAYKNGADLKELQLQLRHHSLDMVNKYMKDLGVMDSDFFKNKFPEL